MPRDSECVLYVASCDAYSDLWPGFFHCLQRYWPENPFPVFLGAESKTADLAGIVTLHSPATSAWSDRVLLHLHHISARYIVFMLEDFFLRRRVDTAWVLDALEFAKRNDAAMVRLIPRPPPQRHSATYPYIGASPGIHPYRVCTQAAIWRREDLIALLRPGESIWQFEINAPTHSIGDNRRYFAASRAILPYRGLIFHHVVEKGRFIPSEYWTFRLKGVPLTSPSRRLLSMRDFVLLLIAEISNRVFTRIAGADAHRLRTEFMKKLPVALVAYYRRLRGYPSDVSK
jgi:hypothetical protein